MKDQQITIEPIGYVRNAVKSTLRPEHDWSGIISEIEILPSWQEGLAELEQFSHITVIYWAHQATDKTKMALRVFFRGEPTLPKVGVFASRSPYRPNALCLKVAKLMSIERNILQVQNLDALDGTPVLDIKPFIPTSDAPLDAHVPDWSRRNSESQKRR
ncbi:MAG: tRNA (N6-threonylcarbamoyladenosine(37)-N6)-methyltransferase TrmO [Dehalococcoidia bacterium]|nr:tRNA (N6-threonylcarbamoyladenosine(37)-N6)-methyltransferase TrmO [Dehalococcoidia bacterium]